MTKQRKEGYLETRVERAKGGRFEYLCTLQTELGVSILESVSEWLRTTGIADKDITDPDPKRNIKIKVQIRYIYDAVISEPDIYIVEYAEDGCLLPFASQDDLPETYS